MRRFRTILFAADFSENSKEAFRVAWSLAVEKETRLIVFHVAEPTLVAEEPVYKGQRSVHFANAPRDEVRHESLRKKMREVYCPAHRLDVEYRTNEGIAAEEILRMADEVRADLIVVGTHGSTELRHLLAGSVATAVLRGAHCPVLAMRTHDRLKHAEGIRVILHPTDFSDVSEGALQVARLLARDVEARLVILHVYPFNELAVPEDPRDYRAALEQMREHADGPDLKHPVETRLSQGDAPDEILRIAGEINCDLIVMGTHGRTGLRRLLMGNVAESVLPEADCPVLVFKPSRGELTLTSGREAIEART